MTALGGCQHQVVAGVLVGFDLLKRVHHESMFHDASITAVEGVLLGVTPAPSAALALSLWSAPDSVTAGPGSGRDRPQDFNNSIEIRNFTSGVGFKRLPHGGQVLRRCAATPADDTGTRIQCQLGVAGH